ncbi:hypothetical protein CEP52_014280 [Fusarium oligoseptatum]|uniref:Uncharacterized protein n=1 Tax=Fusarium oligoseptatum TaxID=2604345 RepID=A0A428SNR4_9HYPO|nr:hypothetical protein CEP52_014280 [Fusarium oligoseptatum]
MATQIPSWLPTTICILDITLAFGPLPFKYLTFYWRGWAYVDKPVTRWGVLVAYTSMVLGLRTLVGIIFSSVNLIRHPQRHTLALRLTLSIVQLPIDFTNFANAFKTARLGRLQRGQQLNSQHVTGTGERISTEPQGGERSQAEISTSQKVGLAISPGSINNRILGTLVLGIIGILAFVATVLSFTVQDPGFKWIAILMWIYPPIFMMMKHTSSSRKSCKNN